MKKFLLTLFAVLTASFAFAGNGTKENPYTVADIQAMDVNNLATEELVWVKAYISGSADNKLSAFITTAAGAVASNLMLSDAQSETDYTKCIPAQLASKSAARTALNLIDNPTNLGKLLLVSGKIQKYFSVAGIKEIAEWELSGEGVDPVDPVSIANTPETAYTPAEAVAIIDAGKDLNTKVYVKGIVSEIKSLDTSRYARAQYYISEDGTTENQFYIYNGYYLGGADFTSDDQLKVGDNVIVYGQLTKYGDTYEMNQNNEIYELNGQHAEETTAEKKTIAEVQALESNIDVKVENAIVYVICKNGAVFGDGTGYIYYYDTTISGLAVGDKVTIEGKPTTYGGFKQFTNSATITKSGSAAVTYPTATEIDVDAWVAAPVIQYVKLQGELSISGNYYNLIIEGKTAQGSIIGAQDDLFKDVANGSTITVEGFAMYTTSSGKYANIVAVKVTVDGQGEQVDISNTPETAYSIAKVIELVDAGKGLEQKVYVKGIISEIVSLDVTQWKRAQYDIVDQIGSETKVRIYNGYYLEGADFTANDQIKVGDEVIVYGQLTKYNELYEVAANNFIYSLNGTTDGIHSIDNGKTTKNNAIYDLSGRRVEKVTKGIYIMNGKKFIK
ncbi:MAG: hypothetical protein J6Y04_05735 [Bacteroidaceae bacterium]|nr:hypothetical protein [Bacteroidaceae bacterium]